MNTLFYVSVALLVAASTADNSRSKKEVTYNPYAPVTDATIKYSTTVAPPAFNYNQQQQVPAYYPQSAAVYPYNQLYNYNQRYPGYNYNQQYTGALPYNAAAFPYNAALPYNAAALPYNSAFPYNAALPYTGAVAYNAAAPYNSAVPYNAAAPYNSAVPYNAAVPYTGAVPYNSAVPYTGAYPYGAYQQQYPYGSGLNGNGYVQNAAYNALVRNGQVYPGAYTPAPVVQSVTPPVPHPFYHVAGTYYPPTTTEANKPTTVVNVEPKKIYK